MNSWYSIIVGFLFLIIRINQDDISFFFHTSAFCRFQFCRFSGNCSQASPMLLYLIPLLLWEIVHRRWGQDWDREWRGLREEMTFDNCVIDIVIIILGEPLFDFCSEIPKEMTGN